MQGQRGVSWFCADPNLFNGIIAFVIAAFVTNLLLGQFKLGFEGQPIAHTNVLWNALGMVLSGLAFTIAGGCLGSWFAVKVSAFKQKDGDTVSRSVIPQKQLT